MPVRFIPALLLVAALLVAMPVSAQETAANPRTADHEALRALRTKVVEAVEDKDVDALMSCFAKDFAFTTVTQTVLTNEAEIKAYIDRMFNAEGAIVESFTAEPKADILTRFLNDDVGVCHGSSDDVYTLKSGRVVPMQTRWSATVVKEGGEWKVATAHVGANFLDNPLLHRVAKAGKDLALKAGLAAALVGLIIGVIIGRAGKGKAPAATAEQRPAEPE